MGLSERGDPLRVVVCGAGPSGLLLAHHLAALGQGRVHVAVFDKGPDPRHTLAGAPNHRRFSIAISARGERALAQVPGLLPRAKKVALHADSLTLQLPLLGTPLHAQVPREHRSKGWWVDRASLCASMVQALEDMHHAHVVDSHQATPAAAPGQAHGRRAGAGDAGVRVVFRCPCVGVDLAAQQASFQPLPDPGGAQPQPLTETYDLLVGADGVHSVVRGAFLQQMQGLHLDQRPLPTSWAVTHYARPPQLNPGAYHLLPVIPRSGGMGGIALPSPDGSMSLLLSWAGPRAPREWLACSTPGEAGAFLHSRMPHLHVPQDAAWALRCAPPHTGMQVKLGQYHCAWGHAVLLGDAAHATAASIGQGCNASLVDASVLARLLLGEAVQEHARCPAPTKPHAHHPLGQGQGQEQGQGQGTQDEHQEQEQDQEPMLQGRLPPGRVLWADNPSPELIRGRLPSLLARFSALQVKEGHALVDLSEASGPGPTWAKVLHALLFVARAALSAVLPLVVWPPAFFLAGQDTLPFSHMRRGLSWETELFLNANSRARTEALAHASEEALRQPL